MTKQNSLLLNPDKTTCTLFTPDPAEYTSNLDPTINNKALRLATHPKVLDLTLDPKLTYITHIHNISLQAHKPLQIIKALTATGWGKQKETLMATYKAVMRSALEYASSVWSPIASSTSINILCVIKKSSSCSMMTSGPRNMLLSLLMAQNPMQPRIEEPPVLVSRIQVCVLI